MITGLLCPLLLFFCFVCFLLLRGTGVTCCLLTLSISPLSKLGHRLLQILNLSLMHTDADVVRSRDLDALLALCRKIHIPMLSGEKPLVKRPLDELNPLVMRGHVSQRQLC